MGIVNLTPHVITEVTTGKAFQPSGIIARVKMSTNKVNEVDSCPIYSTKFGEVEGIPEPKCGVIYVVSSLALNATDRSDVVSPGNLQRDESGQPIGCVGFRMK